ncbi:hypothetical protein ACVPTE_23615 [Salmonella enterica subsp. enterica serovar Winslow]
MNIELTLPKKAKALIDINVDTSLRSMCNSEIINVLCIALAISADGTKHYHEAMDLIKSIAPDYYNSVAMKKSHL